MRCMCMCVCVCVHVYVYLRARAFVYAHILARKKRETYVREGWRRKHIEREKGDIRSKLYVCELTLRNCAKICRERGFLRDGWWR